MSALALTTSFLNISLYAAAVAAAKTAKRAFVLVSSPSFLLLLLLPAGAGVTGAPRGKGNTTSNTPTKARATAANLERELSARPRTSSPRKVKTTLEEKTAETTPADSPSRDVVCPRAGGGA